MFSYNINPASGGIWTHDLSDVSLLADPQHKGDLLFAILLIVVNYLQTVAISNYVFINSFILSEKELKLLK